MIKPTEPAKSATRTAILHACEAFFAEEHAPKPFVPGKTYLPATTKLLDVGDLTALIDASLDLWLTAGRFAEAFEAALPARFMRKAKALLVNSGSSANLLAVSCLGVPEIGDNADIPPLQPGDEIITAAVGFPTTVNPIIQNGWTPVLVDVDLATLNVSPEAVMAACTPKTRAVVLAHTLGNPYRSDVLAAFCQERKMFLIEDCCDALGATIGTPSGDKPAGSFGDYATLSFYPAHHITMGEGGAVVARNARLRRVAESLRDWGRDCWCDPGKDNTCGKRFAWQLGRLPEGYDHKYTYSSIGYNLKATDMQAAIGLSQLGKVDDFIARRRHNWQALYDGIGASPLLRKYLLPVTAVPGTNPSWFGFPVHCVAGLGRNPLTMFLEERKVGTRLVFAGNIVKQPAYRNVAFRVVGKLEAADLVMNHAFWIGVHPTLGAPQIAYMLEQLEAGVRAQGLT